jgi:CxxC motif-containing protein
MREERDLICVACPVGCQIRASVEEGRLVEALGPACKRGVAFAEEEIRAPRRMLTTTVQVVEGELPLVPVRSSAPLPKDKLLAIAANLRRLKVPAPVALYQVIASDALGTGVDMVASRAIAARDAAEPA